MTRSEHETIELGSLLARALRPGDVIAIDGDLGAGKTRLIRGVARALGVDEKQVASPTYVIAHEYPAGRDGGVGGITTVHHVDAYRLRGGDELDTIGWERIVNNPGAGAIAKAGGDGDSVLLIEWPSRIAPAIAEIDPDRVARILIERIAEDDRVRAPAVPSAPDGGGRTGDDANTGTGLRRITITFPPGAGPDGVGSVGAGPDAADDSRTGRSFADRVELEALMAWGLERSSDGAVRLVGGLPAGWTRCPTTRRPVSPGNPAFPFVDARARDADLNRWFTGAYTISRELTMEDADDPELPDPQST